MTGEFLRMQKLELKERSNILVLLKDGLLLMYLSATFPKASRAMRSTKLTGVVSVMIDYPQYYDNQNEGKAGETLL